MVRLTDRPDMTLDVYRGRKTTIQYLFSPSKETRVESVGKYSNSFGFGIPIDIALRK